MTASLLKNGLLIRSGEETSVCGLHFFIIVYPKLCICTHKIKAVYVNKAENAG